MPADTPPSTKTRPRSPSATTPSSAAGTSAGAQPKRTVVGFSPSVSIELLPQSSSQAIPISRQGSSKSFGAVQDIRPKSGNADAVVSSQLASSSERSSVASTSSSYGAQGSGSSSYKRLSVGNAAPLGSSASAAISATLSAAAAASSAFRVGSPSRRSFEDRLFSEDFQNKTKLQAKISELNMLAEDAAVASGVTDMLSVPSASALTRAVSSSVSFTNVTGGESSADDANIVTIGNFRNSTSSAASNGTGGRNSSQDQPKSVSQSGQPSSDEPPKRKSQKEMTKAERRELQERQRAEKKAREAAGLPKSERSGQHQPKQKQGQGQGQHQHHSQGQAQAHSQPKPIPTNSHLSPHIAHSQSSQSLQQNQSSATDLARITSPSSGGAMGGGGSSVPRTPSHMRNDDIKKRARAEKAAALIRKPSDKTVPLFSHLTQFEQNSGILAEARSRGLVHPAVLALGVHFSEFMISGGNARCMAMLLAFKKVIADYSTPAGTSLQRHLTQHIGKQVDFLSNTRSLCTSMKVAIRFLKNEISMLSIDLPDEDAKQFLCKNIDMFISQRIVYADDMILNEVLSTDKIKNGDVILTFARSSVVLKLLLKAHANGIKFRVIVADGRPKFEGKETLRALLRAGIKCTYVLTNALPFVIKEATKVMIGASAVLSNGAIMSRIGTSVVSMMAHEAKVPVMVLCETLKFSDTVRLDSFVWNEIGNPDDLVDISNRSGAERHTISVSAPDLSTGALRVGAARTWRELDALKLLNLYYDITPAQFVAMVVCEFGQIPSTSVLSVLREPMPTEYLIK